MKIVKTHTGKIYVDTDRQLEFLTVGDYGKENNIKADFLGLHKEINGVANTEVNLTDKWVATVSSQKGCPMKCKFCDCPRFGFHGNATVADLIYEVQTILQGETVDHTDRFNVHFARMGEPTFNENVLEFTSRMLRPLVSSYIKAKTIHPVVSTMLPLPSSDSSITVSVLVSVREEISFICQKISFPYPAVACGTVPMLSRWYPPFSLRASPARRILKYAPWAF